MPRIPGFPAHQHESDEVVQAVRKRRGGQLSNLDLLLLHSPPLAGGWNTLMGGVRSHFTIARDLQELLICAVAVFTRAEYEYFHHAPLYLAAGGTRDKLEALQAAGGFQQRADLFTPCEMAALQLAHEMTLRVQVQDATFSRLQEFFTDERSVVEVVATIASYNMVARFLEALNIRVEEQPRPDQPTLHSTGSS